MLTHTAETWNGERKDVAIGLPVGSDGVYHSVRCHASKTEMRFLAALITFSGPDLIRKALEYAVSDRA